jgi:hypothetical protein
MWRREWDSNPRYGFPYTRFPSVRLQPLGHPSIPKQLNIAGRMLLREATARASATTGQPMQLPVAQAVHQRFFLAAVDLDHGAVDEEREVRGKERHEISDFLRFGDAA